MQKDFNALQEHISANIATNLGTSLVFATRNKSPTRRKTGPPKAYQLTCGRLSTPDSSISS